MEHTSPHTQMIIDFICDTKYEDIPEIARENAKGRILDTLGVMVKGGKESVGSVMKEFISRYGGKAESSVVNFGERTDVLTSTFVNGCLSHAIDFDDHYILSHPSIGVVPALISVGEMVGASGEELITAYVVGLEIYTKVQKMMSTEPWYRGFHASGIWGTLSSCATAGKLLGLNKEQMLNAWGTACSSFCGIKRNMGTMTKPFHAGRSAEGGIRAALLAQIGCTSHPDAFEGRFGLLYCFLSETEPRWQYIEELGKDYDLENSPTLIKPHPSCGGTHAAMNGMLQLIREHDLHEEDIDHVDVGMNQGGVDSLYYPDPQNIYEAKFSMHFCMALLMHFRRWGVDLHTEETVHDPAMRALYPKTNFYVDEKLDKEIDRDMCDYHAIVTVYMKDGKVYSIHSNPPVLTYDEIKFKFDCNVDGILSKEKAERISETVRNLDKLDGSDLFKEII